MLKDRVFLSFHWHVWCLQEERQQLLSLLHFPKSSSCLVSWLLLCPISIPFSAVVCWGCISHCALCWVQPERGKSQKKDLELPQGCGEGSSAATSELGALLLHLLPTPPSRVAPHPTFLILQHSSPWLLAGCPFSLTVIQTLAPCGLWATSQAVGWELLSRALLCP